MSDSAAIASRDARLRIWAEATIDLNRADLNSGHDGRSRSAQSTESAAAEDVLALLDEWSPVCRLLLTNAEFRALYEIDRLQREAAS